MMLARMNGTSLPIGGFLLLAILAATAGLSVAALDVDASGDDGQTYGWCGDLIVIGGAAIGETFCSFTINVTEAHLHKYVWWDSEFEPLVSFNWSVDAEAHSPSLSDPIFTQHWQGFNLLQSPADPQLVAQVTAPRVGIWTFNVTFHPSEPLGVGVGSFDTGWWDLKACLDDDGEANTCISNTPPGLPTP